MAQQGNPLYSGSATAQTRHSLLHKVSEISDGPYDEEHLPRRIRGRDSLVSLQSHHDESSLRIPSQASGLWSTPLGVRQDTSQWIEMTIVLQRLPETKAFG
ncbi:hypothetical protein PG990_007999 [Apiospora arundinis]